MGDEAKSSRDVWSTWLLYVLLFVFSVPWYFPAGSGEPLVLGFPLWCFVSLCCYVGVALLTIWRIERLWDAQAAAIEGAREDGVASRRAVR